MDSEWRVDETRFLGLTRRRAVTLVSIVGALVVVAIILLVLSGILEQLEGLASIAVLLAGLALPEILCSQLPSALHVAEREAELVRKNPARRR